MIKTILKIVFASGIIVWLVKSDKLDFSLVEQSLQHGNLLLITFLLLALQAVMGAYRWRILLKVKSKEELPFLDVIKVNWIGLFFNSVLPGIVTGDFIKLLYARDLDKSLDKTFLIMSMLFDRVLGLSGLILLMGVFSFSNYTELVALGPKMKAVLAFDGILFLGIFIFIITLFLPARITNKFVEFGHKVPVIGHRVAKSLEQIWLVGNDKIAVFKCLVWSIFIQFLHVVAFWVVTSPFYESPLTFSQAFSIIPLGDIAVALPIAPAGVGVGHMAFQTLFSYVGINNGANLFNLYFLVMISINLLGFFPYILAGKKHTLKEAEALNQ